MKNYWKLGIKPRATLKEVEQLENKDLILPKINSGIATDVTSDELDVIHSSGITNADLVKLHAVTVSASDINTVTAKANATDVAIKGYLVVYSKESEAVTGNMTVTKNDILTEAGIATSNKILECGVVNVYEVSGGTQTAVYPYHAMTYNTSGAYDLVSIDITGCTPSTIHNVVIVFRLI